jgi:membrane protein DedA with SNARE-associated domain
VLTAIILPIPVEFALFIRPETLSPFLIAGVIGVAKMVGASLIFVLGLRVEGPIRYYSARYPILGRIVGYITRFVRVTKWIGLFVLLAIPFFPDTIPIYLYSLFNKQGQLIPAWVFLLVNLVAGALRAIIFFFVVELFGVQLVL